MWTLRLFQNAGGSGGVLDGYIVNFQPGAPADGTFVYRMDNGVATLLEVGGGPGALGSPPQIFLVRIRGSQLQVYVSDDLGTTWDLLDDVTETTYRDNFTLVLGTIAGSSNLPKWISLGGGVPTNFRPHVYRRTLGVA